MHRHGNSPGRQVVHGSALARGGFIVGNSRLFPSPTTTRKARPVVPSTPTQLLAFNFLAYSELPLLNDRHTELFQSSSILLRCDDEIPTATQPHACALPTGIFLKFRVMPDIASSTGSLSIELAPKNPSRPRTLSSIYFASSGAAIGPP